MAGLLVPKIECTEQGENYGRFIAEPLEKGFGVTLGNSLRRVLIGYLPGAAITQVRIEGVHHEFTVIPNAKEDVMEFLLNIKEMRLKPLSDRGGTLILDVESEGRICASDIKPSADFEITNPDLCLITLNNARSRLYVEMDVEIGTGFRVAESSDSMPVGTIPVDAIFTPIRKVNYVVEPSHLGRETSRERLSIDIWTDGTTLPVDAISHAASILIEQFTPFVEYVKISQMKDEERLIRLSIPDEKYNMPVEQLDLSVRTMNCLRRSNIATVGELIGKGTKELLKLRNFGQKSFQEIEDRLTTIGLSLNPKPEEPAEEEVEEEKPKAKSKRKSAAKAEAAESEE
ncbi:MAG: DNA-directed RNA polymerase subunit alpha [Chloroflexi bacterium RBG_13_52_12]|nr:MAG: DNA-directed RNA polymerase subunit alpha [Chloroflexi bacterium RBG_13_52_12]